GPHLVRHLAVRPGQSVRGALCSRAAGPSRHRLDSLVAAGRAGHSHRDIQELPHADAEQLQSAVQREDLTDPEDRTWLIAQVRAASTLKTRLWRAGSLRLRRFQLEEAVSPRTMSDGREQIGCRHV